MDKQQLEAIRARDADDYAAADVLRNIRSAGNTDPELEATINMIADRRDLLAAYDALLAAAKKVTCKRCDDSGVEPWSDFGGAAAEPCPDCADLRRLLSEVKP